MRLCQNRGRGRDNLDGQGLRLLHWCKSISSLLLPAANLHHKDERRGHLLPHGQLWINRWMESQMDGSDTRSATSSHTCIITVSDIAMVDQTIYTHAKKKLIICFLLQLGGWSAKAEEKD